MPVTITIEAANAEDARTQLRMLLGGASVTTAPAEQVPVEDAADTTEEAEQDSKPKRGRKPKAKTAEAKRNISDDPENRVDPENEDDADAQEADAEDEAAEAEQEAADEVTLDDIRQAIGAYVTKFGMPAAQEDGPGIFRSVLGTPPEGEAYWKMSILPQDQAKLAACRKAWADAAAGEERQKAA